jgi:glutathione S-transferase
MSKPVVHGINFSSYVRSVRAALIEKGVEYDLDQVNILTGETTAPAHLARHPFGKIPAFTVGALTIYETSAIIRYIDAAFRGPRLQASDAAVACVSDQVIGIVDSYGYACIIGQLVWQRMVNPMLGGVADDAIVMAALPRVRLCVAEFARLLGKATWFGGADISLGDLVLAPVLAYMMGTEEGRAIMADHPNLAGWFARIMQRPSMTGTEPVFG